MSPLAGFTWAPFSLKPRVDSHLSFVCACQARQLAALFLRKKINTYWIRLNDAQKAMVKQTLIQRLQTEPERPIRRALCGYVAEQCYVNHKQPSAVHMFVADRGVSAA